MDATSLIIQLVALVGALGTITAILGKQVSKSIKDLDYNNCKTALTDFLSDVDRGIKQGKKLNEIKSEIQILRYTEIYDKYIKKLNGNSFVEREWERLMKAGE